MARVLIVDAHGDDALLGMGGTIAMHTKHWGDEVRILIVTDGGTTQYAEDYAVQQRRRQQVIDAHEAIGLSDVHPLDFPDMRLDTVVHVDLNAVIERHCEEFRPDVLYCVHPDVNMDHRCLFNSCLVASRPVPGNPVRKLVTYAPLSSTEWEVPGTPHPFQPNTFVDIARTLEDKLQAMKCLATELRDYPHPRSLEGIRVFAAREGSRVGLAYAEPLCVLRDVVVGPPAD